jgi:hypothetical protein
VRETTCRIMKMLPVKYSVACPNTTSTSPT